MKKKRKTEDRKKKKSTNHQTKVKTTSKGSTVEKVKTELKLHPFDNWFKKSRFKLVKGKHYNCMPHSMSQQIRNAAAKRGLTVSVHIQGEILIVSKL